MLFTLGFVECGEDTPSVLVVANSVKEACDKYNVSGLRSKFKDLSCVNNYSGDRDVYDIHK